jgi:hypothetical protein
MTSENCVSLEEARERQIVLEKASSEP